MKYLIISIVVFISQIIFPQQNQENYKTIALSFEVYALSLRDFYGGIGGKLWFNDKLALVASIGGGITKSEIDYNRNQSSRNSEETINSLIFGAGIENHFIITDDISAYIPVHISFRLEKSNYESSTDTSNAIREVNFNSNSLNFDFGFGAEFWITKRISLAGQHVFNLFYNWDSITSSEYTGEDKRTSYGLRNGTSALILSIYF